MDIERMTKNPNPDFFIFFLWGGGVWGIRAGGQGKKRGWWEVGAIIFMCDTLFQP